MLLLHLGDNSARLPKFPFLGRHDWEPNAISMLEIDGVQYKTIQEAAKELRTTDKTLRNWIEAGIVSEPPTIPNGLRERRYFPDELIEKYKQTLAAIREERKQKRKRRKNERQRTKRA